MRGMTVCVEVRDGIVVAGASIIGRFIGQPIVNLERWMRRQGGFVKRSL